VDAAVPAVEVADHADSFRVRRPHREAHARDAEAVHWLRAQHAVALMEPAFAEKEEVILAEGAGERIGVVEGFQYPVLQVAQTARSRRRFLAMPFEQAMRVGFLHVLPGISTL